MIGKFKIKHYINYIVIGIFTAILGGMTLAGNQFDNSVLFLLEKIGISIILAVSLSLVVGFLGELSLGHAGFMSVGAFVGVVVAGCMDGSPDILRFIVSMLVGGVFAGIAGLIIGVPVLRLRGDYLAIVTLAFGEIIKDIINYLYNLTQKN